MTDPLEVTWCVPGPKRSPDAVLMGIRMPRLDGLEATRQILGRGGPAPCIVILTTFDLDQYVYAPMAAGASGFLPKDVSPEHLVAAVRLVRAGDALLAPVITRRLIQRHARRDRRSFPLTDDLSALTARKLEVLTVLARGQNNAEIAQTLQLSGTTVKTHVTRILGKLDLRDRAQAIVLAYEVGLKTPDSEV